MQQLLLALLLKSPVSLLLIVMSEREVGSAEAMRKAVRQLHFGSGEEKAAAAMEIRRIAREDPCKKRVFAELGVIPPLVSMFVVSSEDRLLRLAVGALLELANGTFKNKVLIVEAGLLTKLPQIMRRRDLSSDQDLASLLLSVSSLAKTNIPVDCQCIIPCLIETLNATEASNEMKMTCIATLYNLSTKLDNTRVIISSGAVHPLLCLSLTKWASEGALATLGNLVLSAIGKKAIEDESIVPEALMEVIAWDDKPKCQELVAYILMVLARSSTRQRKRMAELKIVPLLLEVALLGTPLAQKRAIKMLHWFKEERQLGKQMAHSGPVSGRAILLGVSPDGGTEGKNCRRAVRKMVRQSLDRNMELIVGRADASDESSCMKAMVMNSSSKSLPY